MCVRERACSRVRCPARGPRYSGWVNKMRERGSLKDPGADIIALGSRARHVASSPAYKSGAPRRRRRLFRAAISRVRIVSTHQSSHVESRSRPPSFADPLRSAPLHRSSRKKKESERFSVVFRREIDDARKRARARARVPRKFLMIGWNSERSALRKRSHGPRTVLPRSASFPAGGTSDFQNKQKGARMWLKVLRQNITHLARRAKGSASSVEQKNGNGNVKGNKTNNNGVEVNRNEDQNGDVDAKGQAKKKSTAPGGGPLLQQAEISTSQLDFFKMLDEKIENGPDYDESLDTTNRAERVSSLLRRWELASVTWSSVSDLNNTSSLSSQKGRASVLSSSRQSLSAKDREGMRNIIGGRPESAPIFVRNRVDGLQDSHHCPSPTMMRRHALESITQSPTQSVKTTTPPSCTSPIGSRYVHDSYGKECSAVTEQQQQPKKCHYVGQNPMNGEYVAQQALYREQYLQQTGIITMGPPYSPGSAGGNVLRNNPYVQHFQIAANPQHFATPARRRGFNTVQMT